MKLRHAQCRGAAWTTDKSAEPHGPHQFFPHQWADAAGCPGWTAAELGAVSLAERLLRTTPGRPGLVLQCHPVVEYALMQVTIPDYREFTDPSATVGMPLRKIAGIPVMRTVAAERGSWKLMDDSNVIAEGVLDQP